MAAEKGEPFTGWRHDVLLDHEINYKHKALADGRHALELNRWASWKPGDGRILRRLRAACAPSVSGNLLTHRYGGPNPLQVADTAAIRGLETAAFEFMTGDKDIGERFDDFAEYLREHHLGSDWRFVSYLAFLATNGAVFTVPPSKFDALVQYYGIDERIAGRVEWTRYKVLEDLAEALRRFLVSYGDADPIQLQSYMWVVASQIDKTPEPPATTPFEVDFEEELRGRLNAAAKRERNGLRGEQFVLEQEQSLLRTAGRDDLAARVRLSARDHPNCGYDVTSFQLDGRERHIEVKTTGDETTAERGFWLSENERRVGEADPLWEVVRVRNIESSARSESLGNVVWALPDGWALSPSSWFVGAT
ncbi:MAG: hypothetical protein DLM70_01815 [Chloroflexi bacterium]|nr:MAG: hypothetical protein DLM70_01815 [Chloroflexota bacterium]